MGCTGYGLHGLADMDKLWSKSTTNKDIDIGVDVDADTWRINYGLPGPQKVCKISWPFVLHLEVLGCGFTYFWGPGRETRLKPL